MREYNISTGPSRNSTNWTERTVTWRELCDRLTTFQVGVETVQEYRHMTKAERSQLKDIGGFVGGSLSGPHRQNQNITGRDLVTLDLDAIPAQKTDNVLQKVKEWRCKAVVYSTRSHSDKSPRLRVVAPLDRTVSADEYVPIARRLAEMIDIDWVDRTCFRPAQLMYWPSCSADATPVKVVYDGKELPAGQILASYKDWKDPAEWPLTAEEKAAPKREVAKAEDPYSKKGVIGCFCRAYTIQEAMDKFLPGLYEETADPNRRTYTGGSTYGGAVIYDDKFLYSYHATDPCSEQLVNAWDMVRIQKFGAQDDDAKPGTVISKLPSSKAMRALAEGDEMVREQLAEQTRAKVEDAFKDASGGTAIGSGEAPSESDPSADTSLDPFLSLKYDGNGRITTAIENAVILIENDPELKGHIRYDEFEEAIIVESLPWDKRPEPRWWADSDDSQLILHLEKFYGYRADQTTLRAVDIVSRRHKQNRLRSYLESLKWDGVPRVDTLLTDYLGAEDTPYTRAVIRKFMLAAVSRAMKDGVKFDVMPILSGPQGIGKSMFLHYLGKDWFSDSLYTFEGKDAAELLRGVWINEVSELSAMRKRDANDVKQFLSKTEDIYRAPYERRTQKHPRRCVFFGTVNDSEFLKDPTGNRRFWPVEAMVVTPKYSVMDDLPGVVDELWAEVMTKWRLGGEPLVMDTKELKTMEADAQDAHRTHSEIEGIVLDYLDSPVPSDWQQMSRQSRLMWLSDPKSADNYEGELVLRDRTCAAEVITECLKPAGFADQYSKQAVRTILSGMHGWKYRSSVRFGAGYGVTSGYVRLLQND